MTCITSLATDDREYLAIIYSYSGPSQLPFTCKELFIASIPFLPYGESISPDMARVIIECGSARQRQKLFGCLNSRIIKRLLKDETISPAYRSCRGLRLAVTADRIDIAKVFLADDRVDADVGDGVLLEIAAKNANRKMVNLLLAEDVAPNKRKFLEAAIMGGDPKIVKVFVQTCPKSIEVLRKAIQSRNVEVVKIFLASKKYKSITNHSALLYEAMMTDDVNMISLVAPLTIYAVDRPMISRQWHLIFAKVSPPSILALNEIYSDEDMLWPEESENAIIDHLHTPELWPLAFMVDVTYADRVGEIAAKIPVDKAKDFLTAYSQIWLTAETHNEFQVKAPRVLRAVTWYGGRVMTFITVVNMIVEHGYTKWIRSVLVDYICRMIDMHDENSLKVAALDLVIPIITPYNFDYIVCYIITMSRCVLLMHILDTYRWIPSDRSLQAAKKLWSEEKNVYTMRLIMYLHTHGIHNSWVIEAVIMYN